MSRLAGEQGQGKQAGGRRWAQVGGHQRQLLQPALGLNGGTYSCEKYRFPHHMFSFGHQQIPVVLSPASTVCNCCSLFSIIFSSFNSRQTITHVHCCMSCSSIYIYTPCLVSIGGNTHCLTNSCHISSFVLK